MMTQFIQRNKILLAFGVLIIIALSLYILNVPLIKNEISMELSEVYESADELANNASIIAEVQVEKVDSFKYGDSAVIFTLSDVTVKKVYKGEIEKKEKIAILESGGIYNNIEYQPEENSVFKKNEKAIVFLKKYEGPVIDKNYYVILGVYQGKFKIKKDGALQVGKNYFGDLANVTSIEDLKIKEK